jgi:RHS repeat-associated protein
VDGVGTTYYLLDDRNHTGFIQVLAEYSNTANPPERAYTYGHDLIAQRLNTGTSYYGYDGHGSVRLLTGATTAALETDSYDYDAYGQLLAKTGTTPNHYRYTGEQWDSDLGMYFLRARYLNPNTGRFWSMDSYEGRNEDPLSLHKYLYAQGNPVDRIDPSGLDSYLLFWGDEDGVPFEEAAETQRDKIEAQPGFDRAKDMAKIISVRKFADVGDALKQYKDIKEIYFYVHHSPDVMHLDMASSAPDSNVSKDGATYKKLARSGWRFTRVTFLTTAFTGWDKSNCKSSGQLFIYGCHSKSLAKSMGLYLFGKEGEGIGSTCYFPSDQNGGIVPMGSADYFSLTYRRAIAAYRDVGISINTP